MTGLSEDEGLLAEIREAVSQLDPLPRQIVDVSSRLLSWRDPDSELAELVADSRQMAGAVRGEGDVILQFHGADVDIVVQISESGDERRLVGQVEPPVAGTIALRRVAGLGAASVAVDELGRFVADRLPPGPISLRWSAQTGSGKAIDTAWQVI
jgi:hypothetical protein